jgi:predicted NBD/HSP70 family sugar kinase
LRAVAVSIANAVDPDTGAVVALSDTPYPEGLISPADALAQVSSAPLIVDNDVNLAALAERALGAGQSVPNFVYVFVGIALGMGLVLNGSPVRGARGLAGEIDYLPIGPACGPGPGRQRLARAASAWALVGAKELGGRAADVLAVAETVFVRAGLGDAHALELVEREGRVIGEAVTAACAMVDPQLVILGGPVGGQPALLPFVQKTVNELAPVPVPVLSGTVGPNPSLRGAVVVALQRARDDLLASTVNA